MMERLALQHADDSFGVLSEGTTLEQAQRERLFADIDSRIVRVSLTILETVFDPKLEPAADAPERCPQCGRKFAE
ncbi:hypothetical protein OGR47_02835 [Methylocystis sp. MJC1]|uniref:hypothetical protein n=1 Tax=Methylocystis sp. MJC1 TaxID=2654282 RepID=UPI0013EC104F|nr:hypothetical protein [Methylocystis sp. MJC1]KAF2991128.1 hypothetical protein MJC1_01861 [Methylocystis sp. MJC1]MBU6525949.1 hypothetical protein [Methylocystis sp. MJC1]UZX12416.1 hypothetical protein OGR47_02835 [Methylocystis sp. MJC1]